jgi:DNA primase large subunit
MEELKKNGMMAHLIASLEEGKDIGHYGRLTFAMVARHFLSEEELLGMLRKDQDFSEDQAKLLIRQVEGKDYNPPKRDRILAWQKEQEFSICPNSQDPDACNVYKDLNFPDHVYEHIQHYVEQKAEAKS